MYNIVCQNRSISQDAANHVALTDDVNQITRNFQDLEGIKHRPRQKL